MLGLSTLTRQAGAVAIALAITLVPLVGSAQDLPSYARGATLSTDETIHGRIRSVDGAFTLTVDDDRGFVDTVTLHPGTIINPTGLTLSSGMSVTILGANAGSAFSANEIDTPYSYSGPLPTPVYYGPGYWCPGFGYGYGPSFSLAIIIGGGYGPWSFEHRPFYGRPWDGHGYFGGYVGEAAVSRGRMEVDRHFGTPTLRGETSVRTSTHPTSHVPAAFAGRSFAGESRQTPPSAARNTYTQEVRSPAWRSGPTMERAQVPVGATMERGRVPVGPTMERAQMPVSANVGRSAPAGGYMRSSGPAGGGSARAAAPSRSSGSHGH